MLHGNVEAKDRGSGFEREKNGTLFGDVFRPARTINSKTAIRPQPDRTRHFDKARKPPREARTARRFIPQSLNTLGDSLAVAIQAGHDSDAAISEEVRRRKDSAVPARKNGAMTGIVNLFEIRIAFGLPRIVRPTTLITSAPKKPINQDLKSPIRGGVYGR